MKYAGMPMGMWTLFCSSFKNQLTCVFGYDEDTAKAVTKAAKVKYKEIIATLPEFEKADRFKMNVVNCAMLGAFVLSMPSRPDVERLTKYYADAMMTKPMKWFCRKSGKKKFTEKDIAGMKATAKLKPPTATVLLEHGLLRISRWKRLRGKIHEMRNMRADEKARTVRLNPRAMSP